MSPVLILLWAFLAIYLLVNLWLTYALRPSAPLQPQPAAVPVSVVIAARNEEDNIGRCLDSVLAQKYPADLVEIWVANDRSTDGTGAILAQYASRHPNVHILNIEAELPGLRAKQNVLAQLIPASTHEHIVVTDADMQHQPGWLAQLVGSLQLTDTQGKPIYAMATGPTVVVDKGWFAAMQTFDWLQGVAVIKALDRYNLPLTAVGNNMAFTRTAYQAVGTYTGLKFSITEDFLLYDAFCKKGLNTRWIYNATAMNRSAAMPNLPALIQQRKRWFQGGKEGPWYGAALLGMYGFCLPVIFWILILTPGPWGWVGLTAKIGVETVMAVRAALLAGLGRQLVWFPLYVPYHALMTLVLPLFFLIPGRVNWKGREF